MLQKFPPNSQKSVLLFLWQIGLATIPKNGRQKFSKAFSEQALRRQVFRSTWSVFLPTKEIDLIRRELLKTNQISKILTLTALLDNNQ